MINLLIEILILGLFCNGLQYAASEGYVLSWFRVFMQKLPKWIFNPVIGCIYCMASFWGFIIHTSLAFNGWSTYFIVGYPIVMVCGVWVNGLLNDIINKINRP